MFFGFQAKQQKELRAVTEGWVVEARGKLQQLYQLCVFIKNQIDLIKSFLSQSQLYGVLPLVESIKFIENYLLKSLQLSDPNAPQVS